MCSFGKDSWVPDEYETYFRCWSPRMNISHITNAIMYLRMYGIDYLTTSQKVYKKCY